VKIIFKKNFYCTQVNLFIKLFMQKVKEKDIQEAENDIEGLLAEVEDVNRLPYKKMSTGCHTMPLFNFWQHFWLYLFSFLC